MTTEETPAARRRHRARTMIETALRRSLVADLEEHGSDPDGAFEARPAYPGATHSTNHPRPMMALWPAHELRMAAAHVERTTIQEARASGAPWSEIAKVLRLEQAAIKAEMPLGMAAWRYAVLGVAPDRSDPADAWTRTPAPALDWRCWSCAGYVLDGNPEEGVAAERGHTGGCLRHQEERDRERKHWDRLDAAEAAQGSAKDGTL